MLDNVQANKLLLILVGAFVLLVFMDVQARRHYNAVAGSGTPVDAARKRLERAGESLSASVRSTVEESAVAESGAGESDLPEALSGARESLAPVVEDSVAEQLEGGADLLPEEIDAGPGFTARAVPAQALRARLAAPVHRIRASEFARSGAEGEGLSASEIIQENPGVSPTAFVPVSETSDYYLYFIRFSGSQSDLIRVRRPVAAGQNRLDLQRVLAELRAGPSRREPGLLSAFDAGIEIHSLRLEKGVARVDLSARVGRLSRSVIQDRLDQLTYTLTQFPGVEGVRLLVDGRPVRSLGTSGVPVPEILRPSNRRVLDYR